MQSAGSVTATTSLVVTGTGAALQLQGPGVTIANGAHPFMLIGTGVGGNGAIENVFGLCPTGISGTVTLFGAATVGADAGTLTLGGAIGGAGDLSKTGSGTLILSGTNTYTGHTNINQGVVQITVATSLGSITGGATDYAAGASLQVNTVGGVTFAQTLNLSGTGFNNVILGGALQNISNQTNTLAGNIVLNAGASVGVTTGVFNITGIISGVDLTKVGAGTMILQAANTYIGNTNVNGGTLTLNARGSILGAATATVTVESDRHGPNHRRQHGGGPAQPHRRLRIDRAQRRQSQLCGRQCRRRCHHRDIGRLDAGQRQLGHHIDVWHGTGRRQRPYACQLDPDCGGHR